MRRSLVPLVVIFPLAFAFTLASLAAAQESFPAHPDSQRKPGVPEGRIEGPFDFNKSKIFPGTERQYWLYVPQQYDANKPACSMIVQDGLNRAKGWKLPVAMDNLIHQKEMPPTIGIFVTPGVVPPPHSNAQARYNRSFEYDGMGDAYARFLLDELLPEVGKKYNLSHNPNDRSIAGASSGGICAFTAAWERPDAFRRVLSTIGTFVNLRGGHLYPSIVRKTEPKPLRIFLQDGSTDLDIYAGSWWAANQDMLAALKFSGYDVKHVWGEGGHNSKHAAAIMPDALRWLWRDYPEPIKNVGGKQRRTDLLIDGESWELVSQNHARANGVAVNEDGEVFFTDAPKSHIFKVGNNGKATLVREETAHAEALMFDSYGYLYATSPDNILRFDETQHIVAVEDTVASDLVIVEGGGYVTGPQNKEVWYVDSSLDRRVVDTGITAPSGIVTSADQTLLHVADAEGRFTYCFQIQPDGTLKHKQRYGYLHTPDDSGSSGAGGMTVDRTGRLYIATTIGIQVLDQLGRVHFIFPNPHTTPVSDVVFGGPKRDTLYVAAGDHVYRRRINAVGVTPNEGSVKPPKPGL